ncbi:MAG TPA: hypothetical protein VGN63_06090 [Flavisolibacter sp.]|jgi:hypothetical protein|nr:hypothetical protein [Flavisolibacter sp.]
MRKLIPLLIVLLLVVSYFTKPADKTCIIEGVKAVWGDAMPDVEKYPVYFEQFMNLNSPKVTVKDWVFVKQVQYKLQNEQKTVGYGAFQNFFATVKPIEIKESIPEMPKKK